MNQHIHESDYMRNPAVGIITPMFNLGATELTMICGMCSVLVILPIVIALAYPRKRKKWSANSVKNTPR